VPLRFPRPVMALIAASAAAVSIGVVAAPARADQVRHREWWLTSLGVTNAWAASQGAGVTVAVLSDGVDASHPDMTGSVTAAPAPAGAPVASGQYFGEQGTAIASLIAGHGHGSHGRAGIVGVAPEARILSIPVTLPADDPKLSQPAIAAAIPDAIAAGIRYAVRQGATVIDLPIDPGQPGTSGTGGASAAAGGSAAEKSAISYALARDVVLVAPAGDDGTATDAANYPAAYHGVLAIGAFNSAFIKAPWSSHQDYVTLTAAGVGMLAAANTGGYERISSTSAASAVVSGIVALIRSRYPDLTAQQVRRSLTSSTVFHPADGMAHGSGYGTVNAARALAAASKLSTPPADRAGAGAQSALAPAAAAAPSATQGIGSRLERAGEISGGLLALLLVLIGLYALAGRRRRRGSQPAVTAQWAHRQAQSRYPQAADFVQAGDFAPAGAFAEAGGFAHRSAADPDRMLEVFTTPAVRPDRDVAERPAGHGAVSSRADDGLFAPAARPVSGVLGTGPGAQDGGTADSGPWPSHGPASRAVARRPAVSGAPPWEPAAAPDTELPWTQTSGRHSSSVPAAALPGPAPTEQPSWVDEPAGQSLFERADQSQPGRSDSGWDDGAGWDNSAGLDGRGWSPVPAAGPSVGGGSDLWSHNAEWSGANAHGSSNPDWNSNPDWRNNPDWNSNPDWRNNPDWNSNPDWRNNPDWSSAPAGADRPASGADWGSSPGSASPSSPAQPSWGADDQWPDEPRAAASGLPIRRPGSALPAPLSPSGSLWEPVARDSGDGSQNDSEDPGSRPIYVWNPSTRPPRYQPPPED
jgi:Subtilase family